jgi:hypothetical protein
MTVFDYGEMLAAADELIDEFGSAMVLRKPTKSGSAHNPTAGAPVDTPAKGVVTEYSAAEVDGSRITAADRRVFLKGSTAAAPTTAHLLVVEDVPHAIVRVVTHRPARTTVVYELQVRR